MFESFRSSVTRLFFGVFVEVDGVSTVLDARTTVNAVVSAETFSEVVVSASISNQYGVAFHVNTAGPEAITRADFTVPFVVQTAVLTTDYQAFGRAFAEMSATSISSGTGTTVSADDTIVTVVSQQETFTATGYVLLK